MIDTLIIAAVISASAATPAKAPNAKAAEFIDWLLIREHAIERSDYDAGALSREREYLRNWWYLGRRHCVPTFYETSISPPRDWA